MKYAVVELKYTIKKTFIVPIIYVDEFVLDYTPTMEFYCYISTNIKDEPDFTKYIKKYNGTPGMYKVFILAVKDSIEDALNFQELNRIKSVSMKFRQSANTDAELKQKAAKRRKREKMVQKASQKTANVKNTEYLAHLFSNSNSETSDLSDVASHAEDNEEANSTTSTMKRKIKKASSEVRSQISEASSLKSASRDLELQSPNAKRVKKEKTASKNTKESNIVKSVNKITGTNNLRTSSELTDSIQSSEDIDKEKSPSRAMNTLDTVKDITKNKEQNRGRENANAKNTAYLAELFSDANDKTQEMSDLPVIASYGKHKKNTEITPSSMKRKNKRTISSEEQCQISEASGSASADFKLKPPNTKRIKKEKTSKKTASTKNNNTGKSLQRLSGKSDLQISNLFESVLSSEDSNIRNISDSTMKTLAQDTIKNKVQYTGTSNGKSNSTAQKGNQTKVKQIAQKSVKKKKTVHLIPKSNTPTDLRTSDLPNSISSIKDKTHSEHSKSNTKALSTFDSVNVSSMTLSSTLSNVVDTLTNKSDCSHFCDESNIEYSPDELYKDLIGSNSDFFPNLMNEDIEVGNEEVLTNQDTTLNYNTSLNTSEFLQSLDTVDVPLFRIDENGMLELISVNNIQNPVCSSLITVGENITDECVETNISPPITLPMESVASTPLMSTVNITEKETGNESNSADTQSSKNYKEAYIELEKKHDDLAERNLGLQYALALAAKESKTTPTTPVPFTEQDGGRLYGCGVFLDARQCKWLDKTTDPQKYVNNLSLAIFGRETLKNSSVTGAPSRVYKSDAKTGLDKIVRDGKKENKNAK